MLSQQQQSSAEMYFNGLLTHSNDTVDSGLFSARCSSSGDEESRISPMLNYFELNQKNINNNNNNQPHFGSIINQTVYSQAQPSDTNAEPLQTTDTKLQEQLMEQARHADYLSIIRNRFNSCSSIEPYQSNNWSTNQIDYNNNNSPQLYNLGRRHNSFNLPQSPFGMEQMMPSSSFHDASLIAVQPTEHMNQLSNQMSQSLGSSLMSNLQSMSLEKQICLDPNCSIQSKKDKQHNMNHVEFQCTFCKYMGSLHRACFDKRVKLNRRRNSYNNSQAMLKQLTNEVVFTCKTCNSGTMKLINVNNMLSFTLNSDNNFNTSGMNTTSNFQDVDLNNNNNINNNYPSKALASNQKQSMKFNNNNGANGGNNVSTKSKFHGQKSTGNQQQRQQQQGMNSSQNYRKKSVNGMSIPVMSMQSVRESRSPSPTSYTLLNTKRQSAPVNIFKGGRYRTNSIGSASPFNPGSQSFSPGPGSQTSSSLNIHRKLSLQSPMLNSSLKQAGEMSSSLTGSGELDEKLIHSGNMFKAREDLKPFLAQIPLCKQNAVHIRLEDEGPYGNDEIRCFLLSHFSTLGIRSMCCVLCNANLSIYDRFPLVDGTLFSTPVKYNPDNKDSIELLGADQIVSVSANISNRLQYIYVVCLGCLHGQDSQLTCKSCDRPWQGGDSLQIGTMYKYDIFAAFPCCQSRSTCKRCNAQVADPETNEALTFFSAYSEEVSCQACKAKDFHYVKPVQSVFHSKAIKN